MFSIRKKILTHFVSLFISILFLNSCKIPNEGNGDFGYPRNSNDGHDTPDQIIIYDIFLKKGETCLKEKNHYVIPLDLQATIISEFIQKEKIDPLETALKLENQNENILLKPKGSEECQLKYQFDKKKNETLQCSQKMRLEFKTKEIQKIYLWNETNRIQLNIDYKKKASSYNDKKSIIAGFTVTCPE